MRHEEKEETEDGWKMVVRRKMDGYLIRWQACHYDSPHLASTDNPWNVALYRDFPELSSTLDEEAKMSWQ